MTIIHPYFGLLLILLPLPFIFYASKSSIPFSSFYFLPKDRLSSIVNILLKTVASVAIAAIVLGLLDVRMPGGEIEKKHIALQIVFVIDKSGSMDSDFPQTSQKRVEVARGIIHDIASEFPEDSVAFVAFGGSTVTACHPTFNHAIMENLLARQKADLGSTFIELGILRAIGIFDSTAKEQTGNVIIVVSDGEGDVDFKEYIAHWLWKLNASFYWININNADLPTNGGVVNFIGLLKGDKSLTQITKAPIDVRPIVARMKSLKRGEVIEKERLMNFELHDMFMKIAAIAMTIILLRDALMWHTGRRIASA